MIKTIRSICVQKDLADWNPAVLISISTNRVTVTKCCTIQTHDRDPPIKQEELPAAQRVMLSVAYNIFGFNGTLEESIRHFEASGEFNDMDSVQSHYFENGGMFLVVLNGEQVIGSGGLRRLGTETAELKRMWLLEAYHGQGIGYRLISQLFDFARKNGYIRIRLQTSPEQIRALDFYRKVGFHEILCYNEDFDEISMELELP